MSAAAASPAAASSPQRAGKPTIGSPAPRVAGDNRSSEAPKRNNSEAAP